MQLLYGELQEGRAGTARFDQDDVEGGPGDRDHDPREAGAGADIEGARVFGSHRLDRPKAIQDVPLPEPAGIGRRHESGRECPFSKELLEALEYAGGLVGELDTHTGCALSEAVGLGELCFT
jgi:hypothetical protein